jgi:hypothetical protein
LPHFTFLLSRTKDLELQLSDARLAQQTAMAEQAKAQAQTYEHSATAALQTEVELRKQLALYSGKFDTFQSAIESSNKAFKVVPR